MDETSFQDRTIILGVTGGIAAYKAVELASRWTQRGAQVRTLLTPAATKFITPLTFASVTRQPALSEIWRTEVESGRPEHIESGFSGDVFVVAPATADFLGRVAAGLADDIVTLSWIAWDGPSVFAPAMNDRMWASPAVRRNVATLAEWGVDIVEPGSGHLACGSVGPGRLAELDAIDEAVAATFVSA
jgi:phosphopantothenoylcysteine decarboxylase/phosphopantothenate--cysteine ligase